MSDVRSPEEIPTTPAIDPHVRVVRGTPDDVELAALVAGLAAASTAWDEDPAPRRSAWTDRSRQLRRPLHPGPDMWRWSTHG